MKIGAGVKIRATAPGKSFLPSLGYPQHRTRFLLKLDFSVFFW